MVSFMHDFTSGQGSFTACLLTLHSTYVDEFAENGFLHYWLKTIQQKRSKFAVVTRQSS